MCDFGVKLNGFYGKGTFMLKKIYTAAIIGTGRIGFTLKVTANLGLGVPPALFWQAVIPNSATSAKPINR